MKKFLVFVFSFFLLVGFIGTSNATRNPYDIVDISGFLNNTLYFNGSTKVEYDIDFTGEWMYTAIAHESGNINITEESPVGNWSPGNSTFTTDNYLNWGIWNSVNFDQANLYFEDSNGPSNVALDDYDYSNDHVYFRLYFLTADSESLDYLNNPLTLHAGTLIVGFNDNGYPPAGDSDFDDIIIAMRPVPEPATMLLLGSGLIGLGVFGRKKLFKK